MDLCLLEATGADVNLQSGTYGSPLQATYISSRAIEELTRTLMDAATDP